MSSNIKLYKSLLKEAQEKGFKVGIQTCSGIIRGFQLSWSQPYKLLALMEKDYDSGWHLDFLTIRKDAV